MLFRNLSSTDSSHQGLALELSEGLPTISAFARLCGQAICGQTIPVDQYSPEALTLLAAAQNHGTFDIRGDKEAFESGERFLSVCVELDADRKLLFRDRANPRQTILFLEGFRELCHGGLVMHHLQRDFSLTKLGFEKAGELSLDDFRQLVLFAQEIEY